MEHEGYGVYKPRGPIIVGDEDKMTLKFYGWPPMSPIIIAQLTRTASGKLTVLCSRKCHYYQPPIQDEHISRGLDCASCLIDAEERGHGIHDFEPGNNCPLISGGEYNGVHYAGIKEIAQ